jgi:hypothetical protein
LLNFLDLAVPDPPERLEREDEAGELHRTKMMAAMMAAMTAKPPMTPPAIAPLLTLEGAAERLEPELGVPIPPVDVVGRPAPPVEPGEGGTDDDVATTQEVSDPCMIMIASEVTTVLSGSVALRT